MEHVENIGLHYYQTLRYWRKNFLEKQRYAMPRRLSLFWIFVSSINMIFITFMKFRILILWHISSFFFNYLSKILALGFNDKFIRTWEYYFDYCAAGFKSNTLGNYHVNVWYWDMYFLLWSISYKLFENHAFLGNYDLLIYHQKYYKIMQLSPPFAGCIFSPWKCCCTWQSIQRVPYSILILFS